MLRFNPLCVAIATLDLAENVRVALFGLALQIFENKTSVQPLQMLIQQPPQLPKQVPITAYYGISKSGTGLLISIEAGGRSLARINCVLGKHLP